MASIMANGSKTLWTYVDDDAAEYAVAAKTVYVTGADAAKYGGSAAAGTESPIPNELRMRTVKCVAPGGASRWIPCYSKTATLFTTPGTTVTRDLLGVDVVFTSTKHRRAEKLGRVGTDHLAA